MNYLTRKYIKNNKKNHSYYILLLFSFLFAYIVLLAYNYIDYYYLEIIQGNIENRTIKTRVTNDQLYKIDILINNKYIENIYENDFVNNDYSFTIVVNKFKNVQHVSDYLKNLELEVILNKDMSDNQFYFLLMVVFKIFIILFYSLFLIFSIIIVKIIINKEKNNIYILKSVGFSNKKINNFINHITFLILNKIFITNIIIGLVSFIFLNKSIVFIKWNITSKIVLLLLNYIVYIFFIIFFENKIILKKYCKRKNLIFDY